MPPKVATRWGQEHKDAILAYFRKTDEERWDPQETSGPKIKAILKSADQATLKLLQPHFSVSDGGTKANNNTLYQHYKDLGCEFIVELTRTGWRRTSDGASGFVDRMMSGSLI